MEPACPRCGLFRLEILTEYKGQTIWRCGNCWWTYSVTGNEPPTAKDYCGRTSVFRATRIRDGHTQELVDKGQLSL